MSTAMTTSPKRDVGMAYVLWALSFLGLAGVHRLYMGRWVSGLIWMATGGLCMIGTLLDAVFMPRMIEDAKDGRGW